jgi:nicotinate dehydrogenase subunit A
MGPAGRPLELIVNGVSQTLSASPQASLLHVLRNDLALNGPKYGCGLGQCGACTVLVDGVAARACVIPAAGVAGRSITTLEGLRSADGLHPVQQAFIDAQAAQCGYCLSGMIMMTVSLLADTPRPTEAQIRQALSGNLCRCGTHVEIVNAVLRAADLLALEGDGGARAR